MRYRARISGPLLDRIDLQLFVPRVDAAQMASGAAPTESSDTVRTRVVTARQRALKRQGCPNARLEGKALELHAQADEAGRALLQTALARHLLTARSYHRCLRVARTLADLDGSEQPGAQHAAEALRYREMDRSPV